MGSWPGAAKHAGAVDAALPFFPGRPIRTNSSNLAAAGVTRTSSFNGPASARTAMSVGGHDGSFVADQLFGGCNSAPLTPRSPSYGFDEVRRQGRASAAMTLAARTTSMHAEPAARTRIKCCCAHASALACAACCS